MGERGFVASPRSRLLRAPDLGAPRRRRILHPSLFSRGLLVSAGSAARLDPSARIARRSTGGRREPDNPIGSEESTHTKA